MLLGFLLIALTWMPTLASEGVPMDRLVANGKFAEAVAAAREVTPQDAAYFYNLGTLLFRDGQIGPSVAHLEKAHALSPLDPAISKNLAATKVFLVQTLGEGRLDPASNLLERWADRLPLKVIQAILGLLIGFSAWTIVQRKRTQGGGKLFGVSLVFFLAISMLRMGMGLASSAMVLELQTLRSGPGEQFLDLGRAEAGIKLRISGETRIAEKAGSQTESWSQVRYSSDGIGWIKSSALLLL